MKKTQVLLSLLCILLTCWIPTLAQGQTNPLIDPHEITEYLPLSANIQNILLLGIDKSDASAARGQDYHTDAILVVAVNFDENKVDLVSLPRDTLTYVPGIQGIYKSKPPAEPVVCTAPSRRIYWPRLKTH